MVLCTFIGDFAEMPSKAQQRRKKDKERHAAITGQGELFELIDMFIFNRLPDEISATIASRKINIVLYLSLK